MLQNGSVFFYRVSSLVFVGGGAWASHTPESYPEPYPRFIPRFIPPTFLIQNGRTADLASLLEGLS